MDAIYPPNESLLFTLRYIDTTAGECLFETLPATTWQGRPAHHFRATVRTTGLIGMFYSYFETVDLFFDREKQVPLYVDIHIHDRKKTQHTQIVLDGKTLKGQEIEDSTEPFEPVHHRVKNWSITPGAQSLFSILYFIRARELKVGSQVSFPVSHDEKNAVFLADVVDTEPVHTPKGDRDAMLLRILPSFTQNYYPSVQEAPLVWVSNDSRKTLLRFEFRNRHGKIFGILQNPPVI